MKKILVSVAALMFATAVWAQTPEKMSYQAVVRDGSSKLITSHAVGMRVSVLQGSETGTVVYAETQTSTTNANGLVSVAIGGGVATLGKFADIDWSKGVYYIKTEIDPTGGTDYSIVGASQLLSVPYALYAKNAGVPGVKGETGAAGKDGVDGKSAYQIWLAAGNTGTEAEFLNWLKGAAGKDGAKGLSAYEIWKAQAGNGSKTEAEFLMSLKGEKGDAGNQQLSVTAKGDTLKLQNGGFVIIPGISAANSGLGTFTDSRDAIVYKTVKIGTQTWFAENLKATKYTDNTNIPFDESYATWTSGTTGAQCNHDDSEASTAIYGRIYNWHAVKTAKLCPTGWHVPTKDEWTQLFTYLGGENVAGGKLKEEGTAHWKSPNTAATNEVNFSALPAGYRDGSFYQMYNLGGWWTATEYSTTDGYSQQLYYNQTYISWSSSSKSAGFSVRCLKN